MRDTQKEREREQGRDIGRGRSRLHAGSLTGDLFDTCGFVRGDVLA